MTDILEFIPAIRIGVKYPDGSYKSERHFLDFVVNGQSLWETVGKPKDMVSVFCSEYALDQTERAANRLLLTEEADLPNNRRSLFICSECGDLGCGTVSALVVREKHTVVWQDFGYENTYEEQVLLNDYKGVGPFVFDGVSYDRTVVQAIKRLNGNRVPLL